MDKRDTLIAEQQIQIRDLLNEKDETLEVLSAIYLSLVCIGGPLNDNVLNFDHKQRKFLHQIKNEIEPFLQKVED